MCLNGDLWAHIGNSVTRIQKGVDLKSKGVSLKSKGVSLKSKGVSLKSKGVSLKSDPKRGEFKVKRGEFKVKRGEFKVSSVLPSPGIKEPVAKAQKVGGNGAGGVWFPPEPSFSFGGVPPVRFWLKSFSFQGPGTRCAGFTILRIQLCAVKHTARYSDSGFIAQMQFRTLPPFACIVIL